MTSKNQVLALVFLCFAACMAMEAVVNFPNLPRHVSDTCNLRGPLRVDIEIGDEVVELTLKRTRGVTENTKVYFLRDGPDGKPNCDLQNTKQKHNVFMYQSVEHEAEFEVTCRKGETPALTLEGSLELHNDKVYSLTRSGGSYEMNEEIITLDMTDMTLHDGIEEQYGRRLKRASTDGDEVQYGRRLKRASTDTVIHQDIFVDTLVLIHSTVYQHFYDKATGTGAAKKTQAIDDLTRHFAHLFNGVDVRFKTASEKINIVLTGFVIEETSGQWYESVKTSQTIPADRIESGALLTSMQDLRGENTLPVHDHLISFTYEDMYYGDSNNAGLAMVGQICKPHYDYSVSTCEFQNNLATDIMIAAHEMGHCMSAQHDGKENTCDAAAKFIMSPSVGSFVSTNPFMFSTCSADYFGTHVNSMLDINTDIASTCLHEAFEVNAVPDVSDEVLGQVKDVDAQCVDFKGPGSVHCKRVDVSVETVCLKLHCRDPVTGGCPSTAAARGTTCGDGKWCDAGSCVAHPDAPRTYPNCIHGDQKGTVTHTSTETCTETITSESMCQQAYWNIRCCETCMQYSPCNLTCTEPQVLDIYTCSCVDATTTPATTTVTTTTATTTTATTTTATTTTATTVTTTTPSTSDTTTTQTTTSTTITDRTTSSPTTTTVTTTGPTTTTTVNDITTTVNDITTTTPTTTITMTTEQTTPSTTTSTTTEQTSSTTDATGTTTSTGTTATDTTATTSAPDCYTKEGSQKVYTGSIAVSKTGKTCQAWNSQTPWTHNVKESNFDNAEDYATNYCRDPYKRGSLWCFVISGTSIRYEYCDQIPPCNTTIPSCPNPPVVANSILSIQDTLATYTCQEGYATENARYNKATCRNGVWTQPRIECTEVSDDCWEKIGTSAYYSGTQSVTNGGYTCQRWDSQSPNTHPVQDQHFTLAAGGDSTPTASEHENFCRDPSGNGRTALGRPWCYVTDTSKRWDYCDQQIIKCGDELQMG